MDIIKKYFPGLLITSLIASVSILIQNAEVFRAMHIDSLIIAIIIGITVGNVFEAPKMLQPGIHFSLKKILRLAIILLGFKLSLTQVVQVGGKGLVLVAAVSSATLLFALWLGKRLGLGRNLSLLIGTGTAICGASAIAAVAAVLPDDENSLEDDITFAIGAITLFGTLAMLLYPVILRGFHLPTLVYAVWSGASVHGVPQAVAAGFAAGSQGGEYATLVKLTRVLLIIPLAVILGIRQVKGRQPAKLNQVTIPWFVLGFLGVIAINTVNILPQNIVKILITVDGFLLTVAMAGMGLETSFTKIKRMGVQPFYAGLGIWAFIALLSLALSGLFFS